MSYMIPLLNKIRTRLGMYVGTPSLTNLAMFLRGFELAAVQIGERTPDTILSEFRDWVQARYQTTTMSWENIILRESNNEETAVREFWSLFDEFLTERSQVIPGNGRVPDATRAATTP